MASRIPVADAKRSDFWSVDPKEVLVKEDLRGRWRPPSLEDIYRRATSMLERTQLQPVQCRYTQHEGTKRLLVVSGFTRTSAARAIRAGYTDPDTGEFKQDEKFMLKVTLSDCNDKEALLRNIAENAERNPTSAIDDAFNQSRMRDQYGMSDKEIAKEYKCDVAKVIRLKRLLEHDDGTRMLIHTGKLAWTASLDLLDVDADKRKALLDKLVANTEEGKTINGADLRSEVRDHLLADVNAEGVSILPPSAPPVEGESPESVGLNLDSMAPVVSQNGPTAKPRSLKEMRKFYNSVIANEKIDPAVSAYAERALAYMEGKITDQQHINALTKLLKAEPASVAKAS